MKKQTTNPLEDLITTAEAAQIMGVTPHHVAYLVRKGELVGKTIANRLTLVSRQSVEAWTPKRHRKEKS